MMNYLLMNSMKRSKPLSIFILTGYFAFALLNCQLLDQTLKLIQPSNVPEVISGKWQNFKTTGIQTIEFSTPKVNSQNQWEGSFTIKNYDDESLPPYKTSEGTFLYQAPHLTLSYIKEMDNNGTIQSSPNEPLKKTSNPIAVMSNLLYLDVFTRDVEATFNNFKGKWNKKSKQFLNSQQDGQGQLVKFTESEETLLINDTFIGNYEASHFRYPDGSPTPILNTISDEIEWKSSPQNFITCKGKAWSGAQFLPSADFQFFVQVNNNWIRQ